MIITTRRNLKKFYTNLTNPKNPYSDIVELFFNFKTSKSCDRGGCRKYQLKSEGNDDGPFLDYVMSGDEIRVVHITQAMAGKVNKRN